MERYDTKDRFHAWYEHWHRYHWVSDIVSEKVVADLACGEGYGSALLAQKAKQVYGMDLDQATIDAAIQKYSKQNNLTYQQANILKTDIQDAALDVIVSFETLEHLSEHDQLMNEFKRMLLPEGVLIISTPDKAVYSGHEKHNEFHVRELDQNEFKDLISQHFKHAIYYGQGFQTSSVLAPLDQNVDEHSASTLYLEPGNEQKATTCIDRPTYLIALASNDKAAIDSITKNSTSYLNNNNNALFKHYEDQVSRLLKADHRLAELEAQLKYQGKIINQLQARLGL